MSDYKPVVGDRVRVALEGEVTDSAHGRVRVGGGRNPRESRNFAWFDSGDNAVSVEKIEPVPVLPDGLTVSENGNVLNWLGENYVRQPVGQPVTVFKPGDVLRWKSASTKSGTLVVLGRKNYTELPGGAQGAYSNLQDDWFSSKRYEKVNLSS